MAILPNQRIFAYNTGSPISGTTEYGDLIVGDINVDYSLDYGGVKWWGGPDENFRWVIGNARPGGQPTPSGVVGTAQVGFWGSKPIGVKTDETFLNLANYVGSKNAQPPFATVNDATTWLNANGYYTSYNNVTPTPTGTLSVTPTSTPTMYYYSVSGYSCGVSCTLVGSYTVMSPTPLTIGYFYNNPENRGYTFEILSLIPAVGGAYDLTGEPGYADCVTACVGVTPTPTPTLTQTPTSTDLSSITTYTISGCTNLNELVVDLGPGFIVPGDVFYYTFTGGTPSGCYSVVGKINAPIDDAFLSANGYGSCNDCETAQVTPTPTNTQTPTGTPTAGSVVNMTLLEVGGDVVLSGSGTMNTTSLGLSTPFFRGSSIVPSGAQFGCGTAGPGPFNCVIFTGGTITQPANFGTGGQSLGSSASGDFFGIGFDGSARRLFVPTGYVSGSFINGTTTFNSTTLATLGATPGTYTWSWGSGANASSIILTVGSGSVTPTPTSSNTSTPTPSVTNTQTPSVTPTLTPTTTPTSTPSVAPSGFTVNIVEAAGNVVMTALGSLNINDLTYITTTTLGGSGLGVNTATFIMGTNGNFDTYSGFTSTPTSFGTGGGLNSTSSAGDIFGVIFQGTPPYQLAVPEGYTTGTLIDTNQIFNSATFASLGLVEGTYTYTWGSGANADSINVIVGNGGATPTPTATSATPTPTPTSGATGDFTVTISQQGPDVVWNGSGKFNLSALSFLGNNNIGAGFNASQAIWAIGPNVTIDQYQGTITYPTSFGVGGTPVTSASGSTFGILPGGSGRTLYVPAGYTSNTVISGSATYANNTIAGMGLSGGTYTWSWGTGGNASTLVMTITP